MGRRQHSTRSQWPTPVATLGDAAVSFARGRRKSGVLRLGAAALPSRLLGLGTAVSLLLRLVRRFE